MKKMLVLATLVAFAAPVFAGDKQDQVKDPAVFKGPRPEMMQKDPAFKEKMKEMEAQKEAKKAEMKATKEKVEKLVKEYKKAKDGSKKQQQAREEIGKILDGMRDKQIALRAGQIQEFEKRLADMKARLDAEQKPEAKAEWVSKMTDRVIEEDGDLKEVFKEHGHMGKGGPKGHGFKGGFKGGPKHGPVDHTLPMPPAPKVEK